MSVKFRMMDGTDREYPTPTGDIPLHLQMHPVPPGVDATLAERGARYGEFAEQARITQRLKEAMHKSPNWPRLPDDMKESLEMVASKIARILNGDPDYLDSWHDLVGYPRLIEKRLEKGDIVK
jgi:hypothetical protein